MVQMKWPKDRKKAFLWAAKAFGTPRAARTQRQRKLTIFGICYAIYRLTDSMVAAHKIADFGEAFGIETMYWWPCRYWKRWWTIHDKQRCLFCYLMAALSDKEFEELQA